MSDKKIPISVISETNINLISDVNVSKSINEFNNTQDLSEKMNKFDDIIESIYSYSYNKYQPFDMISQIIMNTSTDNKQMLVKYLSENNIYDFIDNVFNKSIDDGMFDADMFTSKWENIQNKDMDDLKDNTLPDIDFGCTY